MALDEAAVLNRIRAEAALIDGVVEAYSAAANDAHGLPEAINDDVVAIVFPGDTVDYIPSAAAHRHTYNVVVQLLCAGGSAAERASKAVPFRVRFLEAFAGARATNQYNSAVFVPPVKFIEGSYAGAQYAGWELTLRVSEHALATSAHGGAEA